MKRFAGMGVGLAVAVAVAGVVPGALAQQADEVESVLMPGVGAISVKRVAGDLERPWGAAFLPDGRMLVTERPGRLRVVEPRRGEVSEPVEGVPAVYAKGQGGLLDVAVDPDFENNGYIYLSYAKPGPDGKAATALGRGKFTGDRLDGFTDIFVQQPWVEGDKHFGSRIVFVGEDKLFLALAERFQFDPAQDLMSHLGKVIRIKRDGSVPDDNPFVGRDDALPEIWSYGHRNIQAAALEPGTDKLWVMEMGPLGGDELNQPEAGKNYGWPIVSWGVNYDGSEIPKPTTRPDLTDAVKHFSPVISPSGMIFYTGDVFEAWRGMAIVGGLSGHELALLRIENDKVTQEQRLPLPERIREVEQGPDGLLYLLIDEADGAVWRVEPLR